MGIIDALIGFLLGLVYLIVDIIRYILSFFLNLLNMLF